MVYSLNVPNRVPNIPWECHYSGHYQQVDQVDVRKLSRQTLSELYTFALCSTSPLICRVYLRSRQQRVLVVFVKHLDYWVISNQILKLHSLLHQGLILYIQFNSRFSSYWEELVSSNLCFWGSFTVLERCCYAKCPLWLHLWQISFKGWVHIICTVCLFPLCVEDGLKFSSFCTRFTPRQRLGLPSHCLMSVLLSLGWGLSPHRKGYANCPIPGTIVTFVRHLEDCYDAELSWFSRFSFSLGSLK